MRKSVFVTGATSGTGYAIAERFAKEGLTMDDVTIVLKFLAGLIGNIYT